MLTLNFISGKLTSPHLVNKTPAFFGTQNSNAVFVRPLHLSLSSARWINCTHLHPSSLGHFNIILPSACRYSKRSLSSKFSPKTLYAFSSPFCMPLSAHLFVFGEEYESRSFSFAVLPVCSYFRPLRPSYLPQHPILDHLQPEFSQQFHGHIHDGLSCVSVCF